jgi:hypothetical protein
MEISESFAACHVRDPLLSRDQVYRNHGSTGFAWAARRDFLEACGFYDACLTGSGDHLMAHAFAGSLQSPCIASTIGDDGAYARHFADWARKAHALCQGRLGCLPGRILHLWHGTWGNRRYFARNQELKAFDFDPGRDLQVDSNGLWKWADGSANLSVLRSWSETYFRVRDEDAAQVEPETV